MAAKLLHSLTDDNPDLQKQIGCMTGICQLFDRHNVFIGRRLMHNKLPSGNFNTVSPKTQSNDVNNCTTSVMSVKEKQRLPEESSRSSLSSSLSSPECSRTSQPEGSSFDRIILPETPSKKVMKEPQYLGRKSLDLRDVVKDAMHREARGLSPNKTTIQWRDSPRPLHLSKFVSEFDGAELYAKKSELHESLRGAVKLQEAPCYLSGLRGLPRSSSCGARDGSSLSVSKEVPRFSCDGRERSHLSSDLRDTFISTAKLKEQPRLSLDSRKSSMLDFNTDSKPSKILINLQKGDNLNNQDHNLPQSFGTQNQPPSVVAKLMGLDALPCSNSNPAADGQLSLIKTCFLSDRDPSSRSLVTRDLNRKIRTSSSPRKSFKDPASPRKKNPCPSMKPLSSRFPIEPAPWKHANGSQGFQKSSVRLVQVQTPNYYYSIHNEVEKRLKELERTQSGKDLIAFKQILETMQAKGLSKTRKEENAFNLCTPNSEKQCTTPNQNKRLVSHHNTCNGRANLSRTSKLITRPEKLVERSHIPASSVVAQDGFSGLHKLQNGVSADTKVGSNKSRNARYQVPNGVQKDSSVSFSDKKATTKNIRSTQSSTRPQHLEKENMVKGSGSVSPRLPQKKLERRSRPPTPPDSNKPRRHYSRHLAESGYLSGEMLTESPNLQPIEHQSSEIGNDSGTFSYQEEKIIVMDSVIDAEVTDIEEYTSINHAHSPSLKEAKQSMEKNKDELFLELVSTTNEQPSPISVLDASSIYKDDAPSPVKQIPISLKGGDPQNLNHDHGEDKWSPASNLLYNLEECALTSDTSRIKLQNIQLLVPEHLPLNSSNDGTTDYTATHCKTENPDHSYISEILLASGLLSKDLGSSVTRVKLHPSGHPINPGLFFIMEQTNVCTLPQKEQHIPGKVSISNQSQEKLRRKLIFDAVNDILLVKLNQAWEFPQLLVKPEKLAKKTLTAKNLLKELCWEIEQSQSKKSESVVAEEEDDFKRILQEDVMHRYASWTDVSNEIPDVVLDVERSIFKDLVSEIVMAENFNARAKPSWVGTDRSVQSSQT